MSDLPRRCVNLKELAEICGTSEKMVRSWVDPDRYDPPLPTARFGHRIFVHLQEFDQWFPLHHHNRDKTPAKEAAVQEVRRRMKALP